MLRLSLACLALLGSFIVPSSATHIHPRAAAINGFTYTSCQSAYDFLPTELRFSQAADSASMTVELCTASCADGAAFAALYGTKCYCGQTFTAIALGQDAECNTPCPGNDKEICGGYHAVSRGSEWWSLYSKAAPEVPTSTITITVIEVTPSTRPVPTSTLYTTKVATITSCAESVTNCPAMVSSMPYPVNSTRANSTISLAPFTLSTATSSPTMVLANSTSISMPGVSTTIKVTSTLSPSVSSLSTPSTVPLKPYKGAASSVGVETFSLFIALAFSLAFI